METFESVYNLMESVRKAIFAKCLKMMPGFRGGDLFDITIETRKDDILFSVWSKDFQPYRVFKKSFKNTDALPNAEELCEEVISDGYILAEIVNDFAFIEIPFVNDLEESIKDSEEYIKVLYEKLGVPLKYL